VSIFDEPKIDCHNHVLDPARFAYANDVAYRPTGQEIGTLAQYLDVMNSYNVAHALVVGPNSGYGTDNRCLIDVLAQGRGRFKGIAVVPNDVSLAELERLKAVGVVGIAFNATIFGPAYYADTAPLLRRLASLDLFLQLQFEGDQLLELLPLIRASDVKVLIDHCGRPSPNAGIACPSFRALLELGQQQRAVIKLSGFQKFSQQSPHQLPHQLPPQSPPLSNYDDVKPFVHALIDAYGLDACLWASDWPFLKAPQRLDYGPLLRFLERLLPNSQDRKKVLWETPQRLFAFSSTP
jgi:predicted TIM-barrel fold metal-dependent hydrolase